MVNRWIDRRSFFALGGAFALATVAGGGTLEGDPSALPEGDAYAPWRLWNDPAIQNTPFALVASGVLAANPHDTQPWLFHVSDDAIEVFADASRNLGAMDPNLREMHLGLGCCIENMLVAAGPNGYEAKVERVVGALTGAAHSGSPMRAAIVHLKKTSAAVSHHRYAAIPERHTNRYAYLRDRALPAEWLDFARKCGEKDDVNVVLFEVGAQRTAFDKLIVEATEAIIADDEMIADSDRWFRASNREVDVHRDGPTLDAAGLSNATLIFARLFPVSAQTSHRAWLEHTRDAQVASAPVLGLISVRERYDRAQSLLAGQVWQRLHLDATTRGIAMQPLNQAIELIDRDGQRNRPATWAERVSRLSGSDWQATFAFRTGYSTRPASPSPRRRLGDVVRA